MWETGYFHLRSDSSPNIYSSANRYKVSTFYKLHQDISIQIQQSVSIFFRSDRFTPYLINTSAYDKLRRLLYIYVFPSNCRCIYMHITNYMKTNMTTSKLMSGDTSIHRKQITSYYINRDTYINVELVEYRLFQHRYDEYLNIYSSTYCYNYPYELMYIEIFQFKYIHLHCSF